MPFRTTEDALLEKITNESHEEILNFSNNEITFSSNTTINYEPSSNTILEFKVVNTGLFGNKYYVNDQRTANITLYRGHTYTFKQSDSSNLNHPLRFSTTPDGIHSAKQSSIYGNLNFSYFILETGKVYDNPYSDDFTETTHLKLESSTEGFPGSILLETAETMGFAVEYSNGFSYTGTPGKSQSFATLKIDKDTPNFLYYYCNTHSGMGHSGENTGIISIKDKSQLDIQKLNVTKIEPKNDDTLITWNNPSINVNGYNYLIKIKKNTLPFQIDGLRFLLDLSDSDCWNGSSTHVNELVNGLTLHGTNHNDNLFLPEGTGIEQDLIFKRTHFVDTMATSTNFLNDMVVMRTDINGGQLNLYEPRPQIGFNWNDFTMIAWVYTDSFFQINDETIEQTIFYQGPLAIYETANSTTSYNHKMGWQFDSANYYVYGSHASTNPVTLTYNHNLTDASIYNFRIQDIFGQNILNENYWCMLAFSHDIVNTESRHYTFNKLHQNGNYLSSTTTIKTNYNGVRQGSAGSSGSISFGANHEHGNDYMSSYSGTYVGPEKFRYEKIGHDSQGYLGPVLFYNRALSTNELISIFNHYKDRFRI